MRTALNTAPATLRRCGVLARTRAAPSVALALVFAAALAPATASADPGAWLRCRAITDASARLACFDAAAAEASKPGAATPAAARPPGSAATAGAGVSGGAVTPASQGNRATAPVTAAITSADAFGLEGKVAETVDAITSTLPGTFDGWGPRHTFRLANGQVWRMVEGGSGTYPPRQNPKVTVRRAFMGSFLMEIEGVNQALRVRRVE